MSTPETPPPRKPPLTAAGIALVVIGLLILVPSGLCTGLIGISGIVASLSQGRLPDIPQILTEALSFALIPILIGAFLLWAGLRLRAKK
jgi:hypothetical protein